MFPGNFCKLARCTEIEFCVNFDHINSLADKLSNTYTLKRINSDDSLPMSIMIFFFIGIAAVHHHDLAI